MKKLLFTMAAVAFFATASMAQMSFGLKGGINLSKINSDFDGDTEKSDNRFSMNLGGFMVYELADKMALQPELLLSFEGGKDDFGGDEVTTALTAVNIPVLFRYTVVENLNLLVGPQIGINVSGQYKNEDGDTEDVEDLSPLTVAFGFGAAYNVNEKIDLHFRYNAGMTNWYNGDNSDDIKVKVNTIQIGLGYKLK